MLGKPRILSLSPNLLENRFSCDKAQILVAEWEEMAKTCLFLILGFSLPISVAIQLSLDFFYVLSMSRSVAILLSLLISLMPYLCLDL